MKRFILLITALVALTFQAKAMSYEQARERALFLTDKMAYELNLTDAQYEAAYEINLDYLMGITDYTDLYGAYWTQRNLDLSYILLDWQYRAYVAASYFYRPIYWDGGYWHFGIYARYPHRDYYYFGCPHFVYVYNGGHSWAHNGGRSWYRGRDFGGPRKDGSRLGMRDGFNRGDYGNGTRTFGGRSLSSSASSTRVNSANRSFGGRSVSSANQSRSTSFGGRSNSSSRVNRSSSFGGRSNMPSTRSGVSTFGGRSNSSNGMRSSTRTTVRRGFNSSSSSNSSSFGGRSNVGSFSRSGSSAPTRTFTPSSSNRSSMSTRSFGGSSSRSGSFGGSRSSGSFSSGHSASKSVSSGRFSGGHR